MVKSVKSENKSNKTQNKSNKLNKPICPVLIPTLDGSADISSIVVIDNVIKALGREPVFMSSMGYKGLSLTRTWLFENTKKMFEKNKIDTKNVRGFLLDSAIYLDSQYGQRLFNHIIDADAENKNFVIPYNFPSGDTSILKEDKDKYLKQIKQGEELPNYTKAAGLGFYYGRIPVDYVFHNDMNAGEDVYFFLDNFKENEVRVIKDIKLLHKKIGFF